MRYLSYMIISTLNTKQGSQRKYCRRNGKKEKNEKWTKSQTEHTVKKEDKEKVKEKEL